MHLNNTHKHLQDTLEASNDLSFEGKLDEIHIHHSNIISSFLTGEINSGS